MLPDTHPSILPTQSPTQGKAVPEDERYVALGRVLASEPFIKAARLTTFLRYVCEKTIAAKTDEITEQQVGVHVFGRSPGYNSADDPIVRGTARQLRQKLALYYVGKGAKDRLRINIPKGTYIPQFERCSLEKFEEVQPVLGSSDQIFSDGAVHSEPLMSATSRSLERTGHVGPYPVRAFLLGVCAGVVCLTLAYSAYRSGSYPTNRTDRLWALLFEKSRPTLLVLGDAGLNMYTNLAQRQVDVQEYATRRYLSDPAAQTPPGFTWAPFARRSYTTVADAKLLARLTRIATISTDQMQVRSARSIEIADLQNSNAILSGSPNYDPWIALFQRNSDFRMEYDGRENAIYVRNNAPQKGELRTYKWSQSDPARTGYALLTLTDNLQQTGHVLLIQGTAMGGVETAAEFLFNPDAMDKLIGQATQGKRLVNFELLLRTTFFDGGSLKATVVAQHLHQ